jgi:hypothetical protein
MPESPRAGAPYVLVSTDPGDDTLVSRSEQYFDTCGSFTRLADARIVYEASHGCRIALLSLLPGEQLVAP